MNTQVEISKYGSDVVVHSLTELYLSKTYNFEKSTPENFARYYKAIYDKIKVELYTKHSLAE